MTCLPPAPAGSPGMTKLSGARQGQAERQEWCPKLWGHPGPSYLLIRHPETTRCVLRRQMRVDRSRTCARVSFAVGVP